MSPAKNAKIEPDELMIVNDLPGEECRIAVLQDNHLEELFTERTSTATNVGNIYKGRVANVEPAIQAAFIDYGEGQNGFLHISDLHPRYFPGQSRTERVGKKIPRRDRPPIQQALRRGDEILVQVLKEGLGTKGPTLTSYLSIPGRLLVAMPEMDRVGVSRKIEDEEKRRKMREILDSLDLPEGFGFILRTAGFDKTKTELKRDVAYLSRLWKAMDKRRNTVKAPCELYKESDLLVRTIRDVLRPSIKAIIVDSDSAFDRASNFLRVAAPRSAPKILRHHTHVPIFHAFDIERQIELIHSRTVPLPSGGAIVIDQTEALVAIDVNSGRSRAARDSETNAYQTNCEAVDEICRQLRLRDLGGLIVNDLIDMRPHKNRRLIEERFRNNLKRDRARATMSRISEFGLVEMTRQRMRPSWRKSHFVDCSHCNGQGEIKSPETVGSDAARYIGYLLHFDRVQRVELVCSPRVASVLLSTKRRELVRLEDSTGKRIDVRVSDAIALDRVDFYAYDDRNADIDIAQLDQPRIPSLKQLESESRTATKQAEKRAVEYARAHDQAEDAEVEAEKAAENESASQQAAPEEESADGEKRGRRRRRRRGGRGRKKGARESATPQDQIQPAQEATADLASTDNSDAASTDDSKTPPSTSSRRQKKKKGGQPKQRQRGRAKLEATPATASGDEKEASPPGETSDAKPVRIHTLAKELNVPSRELLQKCHADPDVDAKNHMSSVPADVAEKIRGWFEKDPTASDHATRNGEAVEAGEVPAKSGTDSSRNDDQDSTQEQPRRRRRRRRGGAGRRKGNQSQSGDNTRDQSQGSGDATPSESSLTSSGDSQPAGRDRTGDGDGDGDGEGSSESGGTATSTRNQSRTGRQSKKKSGRKKSSRRSKQDSSPHESETPSEKNSMAGNTPEHEQKQEPKPEPKQDKSAAEDDSSSTPKKKPRRLYRNRAKVSPTARDQAERTQDS
ncbi:MAG: Rne/Rng family ribonuclease [Phycisphaerales bacterium]|nr:MAG: Rne/Rng family ribonuclease [Phycisphaerales bacterium]